MNTLRLFGVPTAAVRCRGLHHSWEFSLGSPVAVTLQLSGHQSSGWSYLSASVTAPTEHLGWQLRHAFAVMEGRRAISWRSLKLSGNHTVMMVR